jgi:hypothetical protein
MSSVSNDSTKLLTEKLTLSRELSTLKPELEHLRTQVNANQQLLSEKLSLERQLNTVQVELENAQRAAQRAKERQRKTGDYDATYEAQLDQLQKQLKDEKVARREAQREIERRKSEEAASRERPSSRGEDGEIEHLKTEVEELRKELSTEKIERQKAEKAIETEKAAWEAHRSLLDDKLAQFRTKLRSTKEQLKEKAAELDKIKQNVPSKQAEPQKPKKVANPRKRAAAKMEPDASNLGTPGDGQPAKRAKKTMATMPGEKSTFSITPFLNRTMSVPPESPGSDQEVQQPQAGQSIDNGTDTIEEDGQATPSARPKKASVSKKPLAPAASAKANANSAPKRKKSVAAAPALEKVAEESPEKDENTEPQKQPPTQSSIVPKLKTNHPPRKSLLEFSTFNVEPVSHIKKKQRTLGNTSLLGGNTTTLFDEDDDDRPAPKAIPGKGIWGGRTMAFGKGGFANAKNRLKGPLMMADDGSSFQFSPLKKDRRRMAEEVRRAGETTVMG